MIGYDHLVLPGRTTGDPNYSRSIPKKEVGSGAFESYAQTNGGVYVVRHTDLVLPCYVCVSIYCSFSTA